jgi:hypothetical protein
MTTRHLLLRTFLVLAVLAATPALLHAQTATKLQVLLPGEVSAPRTPSCKTGTPRAQIVGVPFNLTINAVSEDCTVIRTVADELRITSTDPSATLPVRLQLEGGTATLAVTHNLPGTWTFTVTDFSDPSKTSATSSPVLAQRVLSADVALAKMPDGMLAAVGAAATDTYTLVNRGTIPTVVQLTQIGVFFQQTPSEFTLAPGQSQVVSIVASAQQPGVYEGLALPRGENVPPGLLIPIKLVVATRPNGVPDVQPALSRVDITERDSVITVDFRNVGNTEAIGTFVSDAPWLIVSSDTTTIAPGLTATVRLTFDRSKRSDVDATLGSQAARLEFIYAKPAANSSVGIERAAALVTIYDTVGASAVSSSVIPAFSSSETARFLLGLNRRDGRIADVSFANAGTGTASDLTLYFIPAGGSSFFARSIDAGDVFPSVGIELSNVLRTVFAPDVLSSNALLRSRAGAAVVLAGSVVQPTPAGNFGTATPMFRSDRAAIAGESIYLTGIRRDSGARTDIYIQETAKLNGSVQVEFFDESGALLAARPVEGLAEYGAIEIIDAAPAGAVLARVTNRSTAAARIVAEARVVHTGGDVDSIVDASEQLDFPRTDRVVIPIPRPPQAGGVLTDVYITNVGAQTATGVLTVPSSQSKRRAVRAQAVSGGLSRGNDAEQEIALGPLQTRVVRNAGASASYITFTPAGGQFVVSSRSYFVRSDRTAGTVVPGIGVSSSLQLGATRLFAGIEDASRASIGAARAGTYRTSLGLIGSPGADATVRLTVRFRHLLAFGTSMDTASRDVTVSANQLLVIDDLVRFVVGPGRDGYTDLRDVQLDVTVTAGGAVIPYLVATENASGDLMFTTN